MEEIGGGIPNGKEIQNCQTGEDRQADAFSRTSWCSDRLRQLDGSGSMMDQVVTIVMDENTCMNWILQNSFWIHGRWSPAGNVHLAVSAQDVCWNFLDKDYKGAERQHENLDRIGGTLLSWDNSLCALGLVLQIRYFLLCYFRDEYIFPLFTWIKMSCRVCKEVVAIQNWCG